MKNMRHVVSVMAPPGATDSRGQEEGKPTVVRANVPCSIETIGGAESEAGQSNYPTVNYQVEMYADPKNPVTPDMYLTGGTIGKRELQIRLVNDSNNMHTGRLTLFCTEAVYGG